MAFVLHGQHRGADVLTSTGEVRSISANNSSTVSLNNLGFGDFCFVGMDLCLGCMTAAGFIGGGGAPKAQTQMKPRIHVTSSDCGRRLLRNIKMAVTNRK